MTEDSVSNTTDTTPDPVDDLPTPVVKAQRQHPKWVELKGFESFTKPHDPNALLEDDLSPDPPPKPVFGKPVRKVRRAL
jgi:hypothetical protein